MINEDKPKLLEYDSEQDASRKQFSNMMESITETARNFNSRSRDSIEIVTQRSKESDTSDQQSTTLPLQSKMR